MVKVHEINEDDIAYLTELEQQIFPDPWSSKSLKETFMQEHAAILGCWQEEKLIGYVIFYYVLDEGEIARIAVDASYRRQGAAGSILRKLITICREKGIVRLLLDVRESNAPAIAFYKKNGFREDGIRRFFYSNPTENALLMSLNI